MFLRFTAVLSTVLVLVLASSVAAAAAADLNGDWQFVVEIPDGYRTFAVNFKVDGELVSGKWAEFALKGTLKDGSFDLSFPFSDPDAGSGTLNIKGTVGNGALSGNWEFNGYSGSFKATRPAAPQP
jgi:hypothetical protein